MSIGERIENLMIRKKLNAFSLARQAGLAYLTVANTINGKTEPQVQTIVAIAEVLGVDPVELRGNSISPKSEIYNPETMFYAGKRGDGSLLLQIQGKSYTLSPDDVQRLREVL
jgi:transcriptional regulator with XRE-family HTH domain